MVKYDYSYALGPGQGDSRVAQNKYLILHDTGNDNNNGVTSAKNEASYMSNNWQNAYTHAVAGHDRIYIIGEPGYVAYGAGNANLYSPYQIELSHYADKALALKAYKNWVESSREFAKKYGIPLDLDGAGHGIKSHKWVSDNIWGDHQDPYGYLSSIGITKNQLAKDLKNGFDTTDTGDDDFMVEVSYSDLGALSVTAKSGVRLYKDSKLTQATGRTLAYGTHWAVSAIKDGAYAVGGYVGGQGVTFKLNTLSANPDATATAKVTADDLYTQAKPGTNQKGIKHLPKGSTWAVNGRDGKYLKVGGYINGDKVKIIL